MLNILVLLISSISVSAKGFYKRTDCDSDSSYSSCYSSNSDYSKSCSDSGFSECNDNGYNGKVCNKRSYFSHKGTSLCKLKNFVSLTGCPSFTKSCYPYREFTRIAEFFTTIPNAPKLTSLLENRDLKGLEKLASKSGCNQNYDAYSAFFYSADSFNYLRQNKLSSDFILYFLTRFYYFLNLGYIENCATYNGMDLINIATKKPVDLLDIPQVYNDATFGSETNATKLFNTIISDTTITRIVIDFISVLQKQISISVKNCCPEFGTKRKNLTTYELYVNLLISYLTKTADLTSMNLRQKIDFITPQLQFAFAVIPYSQTVNSQTKSAIVVGIDVPTYFNLPNTARFI